MMNPLRWILYHPIILLLPLFIIAEYAFIPESVIMESYPLATVSFAAAIFQYFTPVASGLAAFQASRLRDANVLTIPRTRSITTIIAKETWPCFVIPIIGFLVPLVTHNSLGAPGPLLLSIAIFSAWVLLAISLALSVPSAMAVALGVLLPFFFYGFVPSFGIYWANLLTQPYISCCSTDSVQRPVGAALGLLGIVAVVVTASIIFLLFGPRHHASRGPLATAMALALCAAPMAGVFVLATVFFRDLPFDIADVPRTDKRICTTAADVRICMWPEHEQNLDVVAQNVSAIVPAMRRSGIPVLPTFDEGPPPTSADASAIGTLYVGNGSPPDLIRVSMARALIDTHRCRDLREGRLTIQPAPEVLSPDHAPEQVALSLLTMANLPAPTDLNSLTYGDPTPAQAPFLIEDPQQLTQIVRSYHERCTG